MLAARARLLIITLWIGSLWTTGYVVAPTLFATLSDKVLAGTIAGKLFRIEAWLSLACAILMLLLLRFYASEENPKIRKQMFWLVLGMLACTLVGYFGLQPFMSTLRESAGAGGVMSPGARTQFGILHGVSSAFYLIQSLLGAVLVWKLR